MLQRSLKFIFLLAPLALADLAHANMKRILLVGKTGAGKTSFIQMAHEHCRNAEYQSERDFIVPLVVGNENIGLMQEGLVDSTHSQTKEITGYREVHVNHQIEEVEFVDSQGLFDTEGASLMEAQKQLADYLAEHAINAVALVIPASDSRATQQVEEMFGLLDALFGDDRLREQFFVLATFSATPNANLELLLRRYMTAPKSQIFYFDNSCVIPKEPEHGSSSNFDMMLWQQHRNNFVRLLDKLEGFQPIESLMFRERAKLLQNAEELILAGFQAEKTVATLEQQLRVLEDDIQLINAHHYKKWNCGYIGENLATNTTTTPIFGERRRGGIAGALGDTKTVVTGYSTTHACSQCGGAPANHSSELYANLRGQGEKKIATILAEKTSLQEAALAAKRQETQKLESIQVKLADIDRQLNTSGQRRNYIADMKKQLKEK